MIEELSQVTAGGVLALLLIREVFSFLRERRGNWNGSGNGRAGKARPLTGNHYGKLDWTPIELRLDRMTSVLEDKLDKVSNSIDSVVASQAKTNRTLDDLIHSGDKTRQALGDIQESIRYLEKCERNRE